jgi:predicted aldo/keto reductase-like oxidoreductase
MRFQRHQDRSHNPLVLPFRDEGESLKIIDLAFEKGINSLNNTYGYAGGCIEENNGKTLKDRRHSSCWLPNFPDGPQ